MVRLDVPDPPELNVTLLELRLNLGPDGEQVADRETEPAKPLMLARLIVTVPVEPRAMLTEPMLVLRLKSCTDTLTIAV